MNLPQLLFSVGNALILPFWAALFLAPRWRVTRALMSGPWICALLALLYGILIVPNAGDLLPLLAKPELSGIQALLGSPLGAAAGWLHFLAFDLFVARWIWQDALETGRSTMLLRPIMLATLMFGPLGLLLYMLWTRLPWARLGVSGKTPLVSLAAVSPWLILVCLVGLAIDHRSITNLPAWIKPLKFSLSILIYCVTLQMLLKRLERSVWADRVARVTSWCLAVEIAVILLQTARGTTSHFNSATPLDTFLFALMGLCIAPVWIGAMVTTWLLFRDRTLDPGLATALRWAGAVSVVGMAWAWPMTSLGAHTIGAPDGGPGLPLLGWSTVAGDLRVPHFLGLHALQILPLLWLLTPSKAAAHAHGLALMTLVCYLGVEAMAGLSAFVWDPVLAGGLGLWTGFTILSKASNHRPS